jgi:hypothetical protein
MFPHQENKTIMEEICSMRSVLKGYNQPNHDEIHVRKKERGFIFDLKT